MAIAVLSLAGGFVSGYLMLHAAGVLGSLTCGVGDCARVQASEWAVFLGVPVPAWGVAGYAMLFGGALVGLQPRGMESRGVAAGLLALGTVAFAFSAYLTALEAFVIGAWCQWCVVSAILATLIFACTIAELPRIKASGQDHG